MPTSRFGPINPCGAAADKSSSERLHPLLTPACSLQQPKSITPSLRKAILRLRCKVNLVRYTKGVLHYILLKQCDIAVAQHAISIIAVATKRTSAPRACELDVSGFRYFTATRGAERTAVIGQQVDTEIRCEQKPP